MRHCLRGKEQMMLDNSLKLIIILWYTKDRWMLMQIRNMTNLSQLRLCRYDSGEWWRSRVSGDNPMADEVASGVLT